MWLSVGSLVGVAIELDRRPRRARPAWTPYGSLYSCSRSTGVGTGSRPSRWQPAPTRLPRVPITRPDEDAHDRPLRARRTLTRLRACHAPAQHAVVHSPVRTSRWRLATAILVAVGLAFAAPVPAGAAENAYLTFPAFPGEPADQAHQVPVTLATFKIARAASPAYAPLVFKKTVDYTTARFLAAVGNGSAIPNVWLNIRKAPAPAPYFRIQLSNVVVLSDQIDVDASDELQDETISLSFPRAVESYAAQTADGSYDEPLILGWSTYSQTPYSVFTAPPTKGA
jgi:type VI protein secretion system component Hcp